MTHSVNSPANAPGGNDPTKRPTDPKGPSAGAPTDQSHVATGGRKDASEGSGGDSSKRATPVVPGSVPQPVKSAAGPIGPNGGNPVPTQDQGVRQGKTDAALPVVTPNVTPAAAGTTQSPVAGAPSSGHTSPRDPTPIVPNDPAQPKRPVPVEAANVAQPSAGASPAASEKSK